jgi:hypothetical protein
MLTMTRKTRNTIFLTGMILTFTIYACLAPNPEKQKLEKGRNLAQIYCIACHDFPEPDLLTKDLWREILPTMGAKMGITKAPLEIKHARLLFANDLLPDTSVLSDDAWELIQWYYLQSSEASFATNKTKIRDGELTLFIEKPILIGNSQAASLVQFGEEPYQIWYADGLTNTLYKYDALSSSFQTYELDGSPSHIHFANNSWSVLSMGNIHPNDLRNGKLLSNSGDHMEVLIEGLPRPVHATYGDLNNDQQEDVLISGFGYLAGSLDWYEHRDSGYFNHTLRNLPGAIKTDIIDLDKDGFPDILALMAQGDEGFFFYKGDGTGNFQEQKIYAFPSAFGSSYYELADFNEDGYEDIIYVNGDNGDYSAPVMKPYHGIRILINEAIVDSIAFKEEYYYPMHGPFKAMAEDYDLDNDLDIACISYIPDYDNTPRESFIYLENNGRPDLNFTPKSIPGAVSGKWLVADRKDYDGDGDIDVILGNSLIMWLYVPDDFKNIWEENPLTMLLLENQSSTTTQ